MGTHFSCFQRCCDWFFTLFGFSHALWFMVMDLHDIFYYVALILSFCVHMKHLFSFRVDTGWVWVSWLAEQKRRNGRRGKSTKFLPNSRWASLSHRKWRLANKHIFVLSCYPLNKFACEYFPLFSKILSHLNGKGWCKNRKRNFSAVVDDGIVNALFLASCCPATETVVFYIIQFCWNRIKFPCYSANYYFSFWRYFTDSDSHETSEKRQNVTFPRKDWIGCHRDAIERTHNRAET